MTLPPHGGFKLPAYRIAATTSAVLVNTWSQRPSRGVAAKN